MLCFAKDFESKTACGYSQNYREGPSCSNNWKNVSCKKCLKTKYSLKSRKDVFIFQLDAEARQDANIQKRFEGEAKESFFRLKMYPNEVVSNLPSKYKTGNLLIFYVTEFEKIRAVDFNGQVYAFIDDEWIKIHPME